MDSLKAAIATKVHALREAAREQAASDMQYDHVWELRRRPASASTSSPRPRRLARVSGVQVERMVVRTDWENGRPWPSSSITSSAWESIRPSGEAGAPRPGTKCAFSASHLLSDLHGRCRGRLPGVGYLMNDATHRRKRLVVKIGSATLTTSEDSIDCGFLNDLADQVARVRAAGWDVVIVTSAAIACGLEGAGHRQATGRHAEPAGGGLPWGRAPLSTAYAEAFRGTRHADERGAAHASRHKGPLGLPARAGYAHAAVGAVRGAVVNENDTVSVEQIRFGDNDTLAALVAASSMPTSW